MTAKIIYAADRFSRDVRPSENYYRDLRELRKLYEAYTLERQLQQSLLWEEYKRRYGIVERLPIHIDYVNKGPLP